MIIGTTAYQNSNSHHPGIFYFLIGNLNLNLYSWLLPGGEITILPSPNMLPLMVGNNWLATNREPVELTQVIYDICFFFIFIDILHLSNEKKPGCLGYIGDEQQLPKLYRD